MKSKINLKNFLEKVTVWQVIVEKLKNMAFNPQQEENDHGRARERSGESRGRILYNTTEL